MGRPHLSLALASLAVSFALTVSAQRPRAFTATRGGPRVEVSSRVATGSLPKSVRVSPDGRHVVVCNFGLLDAGNVSIYDAATLERVGVLDMPGNAVEAAFSPDGSRLYVSSFRAHALEVFDFEGRTSLGRVSVGMHPKTVSVAPDGATVYVANYAGRSVSVVDAESLTELRRLRTGSHPRGMTVLPDGTLLVASFDDDLVQAFAPGEASPRESWSTCRYPRHLVSSADGGYVFVTCSLGHVGLYASDDLRRPLGVFPAGRNPRSIDLGGEGRWLASANFGSNDVSVFDVETRTVRRARVPGGTRMVGLAVHPGPRLRVYATSWDANELLLFEPDRMPEREAARGEEPAEDRADGTGGGGPEERERSLTEGEASPPPPPGLP